MRFEPSWRACYLNSRAELRNTPNFSWGSFSFCLRAVPSRLFIIVAPVPRRHSRREWRRWDRSYGKRKRDMPGPS